MKKLCILFALAFTTVHAQTQTLITYGKFTVGKDEFLRAFNKNKTPSENKEKAIRDYLELYTNFKLKVKAAESLRLDTLEQISMDMDNFRRQIEENYLNDDKAVNTLMDEAFRRSQQDLHVIRFSVPVEAGASPADTQRIYQQVQELYKTLQSGSENPAAVAASKGIKFTDMGFVTVFSLPYTYENIVYSLGQGGLSVPYRAKSAWHIFKVIDSRKSAGKWRVAHILFSLPENADEATKIATQKRADTLRLFLLQGADFEEMARQYSEDKLTYLTGGELPEFGTGKYDQSFERQVLKLQADGDISAPFITSFGVHVVKRLGYTPTPTDKEDASLQYELKQKLMQDDRIRWAKDKFAKDIRNKIGFKIVPTVKEADLFRFADTVMNDPLGEIGNKLPISQKPVISFTKGNVKVADWLNFVRDYKTNTEAYKGETNAQLWEMYKTVASRDYYRKQLETFSPEFRYQLQEFKEGNLLFEVMERKVWSEAANDTIGLLTYYNNNKANYKWGASADALIVNAISLKAAEEARDSLRLGKNWIDLLNIRQGQLQADSGRYELSQINGNPSALPGSFSDITTNPDGTATFIHYYRLYEAGEQRNFEESRGMVINDYQSIVEKNWLAALRKQYPVKINEALVGSLIK